MLKRAIPRVLTVFLCLIVVAPSILAESDREFVVPKGFEPAELHRMLSEGKSKVWSDKAMVAKMLSSKAAVNQHQYDMKKYDIFINVDDTTQSIDGRVGFFADATEDGVSSVDIDLNSGMSIDSIKNSTGALVFSRDADVTSITLDKTYNTGERIEWEVFYNGTPDGGGSFSTGGLSFDMHSSGEWSITSIAEPYGARMFWPCKDRPDDKADTFKICLRVDDRFYASSNGVLDSVVTPPGFFTVLDYHYTMPYPMTTYLLFIAIHDYQVWYDEWVYNNGADTMPIVNAVYAQNLQDSYDLLEVVPTVLTVLSDLFGLYPFTEAEYGHTTHDWLLAMEHQANTTCFVSSWSTWGFSEPVVVHEAGHQWYGDLFSPKSWSDVWINEAWASYSEAIYFQQRAAGEGWPQYHSYMDGMDFADGGTIYRYDTTNPGTLLGTIIYDKGAWLVHMLRHVVGEDAFFQGMLDYYNAPFAYGSQSTEEHIEVWEASVGYDLNWFFDQWLYGEYRPNYRWSFYNESNGQGGFTSYISIDQAQTTNPTVFQMPVEFVFDLTTGQSDTITLMIDKREDLFVFDFPFAVTNVRVDPANWILNYESEINWKLHFLLNSQLPEATQASGYSLDFPVHGGTGSNTFSLLEGSAPPGMTLNLGSSASLTGTPSDTGSFSFRLRVDDNGSNYNDEQTFTIYINPLTLLPGDINGDSGEPNIADLVYLVDYMFNMGPPPPVINLSDVNGDCEQNIADLVYLVDFMFNGGPAPVMGCIE